MFKNIESNIRVNKKNCLTINVFQWNDFYIKQQNKGIHMLSFNIYLYESFLFLTKNVKT